MALILAEPFSHYLSTTTTELGSLNDDGTTAWTSNSMLFNNTEGRFGARVMESPTINRLVGMRLGTVSGSTLIVGASVKYNVAGSTAPIVRVLLRGLRSNGNANWTIQIGPAGTFYILNSAGTVVATVTAPLSMNVWHRIEVKVVHSDTGSMEIKLDGVTILNLTSTDFLNSTLSIERVEFGGNDNAVYWEDVIIMDGSGATFNDFVGDLRYELAPVDADGATANWTPSAGSNFQCIDDAVGSYDSDSTYVSSSTTDQDNYSSHAAITAANASSILFAELLALARADAAGDEIALLVNSGTVDQGPDIPLVNGTYRWRKKIWETDPNTAAAWTVSNINSAEWGFRKRV